MPKEAKPDRYTVDRKGTPDPEASEYYVLDVIHDRHARTLLGGLARTYMHYGQQMQAEEIAELLDRTSATHAKLIQDQYAAKNPKAAVSRSRR